MPSIIAKLASIKKKSTHTFTVLRHNPELFNESSTIKFHTPLIPSIANVLRPRPTLHLLTDVPPKGSDFTSSPYTCTSSSASTNPTTPEPTEKVGDDATAIPTVTVAPPPPSSPWTCPPSAVPWPPQICAAPLSTHHRLAPCAHVVRTPFLTPCGSNCAHVFVATTNSRNDHHIASPLTPATPLPPLLPFVVDEPFTCAICVDEVVETEAERKRRAFVGLLERNAAELLEGEEGVVAGAYERILAMEMEDERARIVEQLDGRPCEAAEEKDGHGRMCP
ncbi:hypothetical protein DBV05_g3673 [Lasiodiplodia theobromae]|uniref:Uncharacterized protein n=1 Tax=Lasiodiplodia theobromae TaxID=45133 RepID=A0A5N5DI64_9PEZI|nr:hypothetical protein DBV05_g3673 [Lasiodiplodia theobromae]